MEVVLFLTLVCVCVCYLGEVVALSSVVSILITVADVNDNCPQFGQDIFTTTVPEFLGIGASAFMVLYDKLMWLSVRILLSTRGKCRFLGYFLEIKKSD